MFLVSRLLELKMLSIDDEGSLITTLMRGRKEQVWGKQKEEDE